MRWTRQRWARDVMQGRRTRPVSNRTACRTKDAEADGEVVWFRRSKAGVKFCGGKSAQPGFRQNHIRKDDGGKTAWSPRRARRKPLKPLRGECRVIPV